MSETENAIWIAKLLGPVIFALSVPMIAAPQSLQETTKAFLADKPLILISGVLAMTAGLSIVNLHNVWSWQWTVIITLFGWAMVLGGAARIITPHFVEEVGGAMMDRHTTTRLMGLMWGALGAFVVAKGYF